jgi:hypothetical protein
MIIDSSNDMYYGGSTAASYISTARQTDFIQLKRELEMPGRIDAGSYDFPFSFKNVDLEIETHQGIAMLVNYSVDAEMIQVGNMMNYTCKTRSGFSVCNNNKESN